MRPNKLLVAASVAAVAFVGAGCGDDDSDDGSGDFGEVAYVSPIAAAPNQQLVYEGMEAAAESLGGSATLLDSNLSPDKQVANVDTAIASQATGIGSATLDPNAAAGAYNRALEAGIPVIGVNSEGEGLTSSVYWELITCEPGGPQEQNAELISNAKAGANVIIIDGPPAEAIIAYVSCFEAAAESAGLNLINKTANLGDSLGAAQRLAQDLLTKHPNVDAIWAYNDQSALGASAALAAQGGNVASGSDPGVTIIGNSGDPEGIEGVRDGRLTATWDPDNMGTGWGVVSLIQTAVDEGVDETYPRLVITSTLYTSENVADYVPPKERSYDLDSLPVVEG